MKRLKSGIKINNMAIELMIGDGCYFVIGELLILLFAHRRWYVSIGFLCGVLISIYMIISMAIAMEEAMSLKEKGADLHIRKTTALRMLIVFMLLVIVGLTDMGNILAALAGVMALKVSAYIQPLTHKVLAKKFTEKGR